MDKHCGRKPGHVGAVSVGEQGYKTSASTVGRIFAYLRRTGQLVEPTTKAISTKKRAIKRPYAVRKPKGYRVSHPGDLLQIHTLDIRPLPGIILKQFTARDTVSRWDVIEARNRATAKTARLFLDTLDQRMPFTIRAPYRIQKLGMQL